MEKIPLDHDIILYRFIENEQNDPFYVINILVLIDGKRALLIDTGYEAQGEKVKKDLTADGITPEIVIFSHFHPDHICGSKHFSNCKLYGSKFFKFNLSSTKNKHPEVLLFEPKFLLDNLLNLKFGNFDLKLLNTPGHSICGITVIINDTIMHVGDLLMGTTDNKIIIPLICMDGSVNDYIASLEKLAQLDSSLMILPHGNFVRSSENIRKAIDDRLYYLRKLQESKGKLRAEECLAQDLSKYTYLNFHEINQSLL